MDAIGTGLNAHSAEADSMRIQFCTVWAGLDSHRLPSCVIESEFRKALDLGYITP